MVIVYTKLFNEDDEVVGCVTLKLLSNGQSYQPAAPFPPDLEERHNKMIAATLKSIRAASAA
jgi:hypothetical protein